MKNKTKIIMLTGFLGAGKTTFMDRLIKEYGYVNKIGVIVNEFGKVNIDAELLKDDNINMAELSNGSIFCACIKDKFVDSLVQMSKYNLDYIYIEASGLADPSNMGNILDGLKEATDNRLEMKGSICITDAETFLDTFELLPALERQVRHSEVIFVNKKSNVPKETISEIHSTIKKVNEDAVIFDTDFCNVDMDKVVNMLDGQIAEPEETTNSIQNRLTTVIVKAEEKVTVEELKSLLKETAEHTYRIKGFVQTTECCKEVSCTGRNINITDWKQTEKTNLVFISSVGIRIVSVISEWMKKNKNTPFHM